MGGYLTHDVLELHLTHGQTRREFALMATVFVVVFAAFVALLMTVGFLLERVLYRVADWPHRLDNDHLYSSTVQVHAIFTEFWLMILIWTSAGALVGSAVYRNSNEGWLAIPLALIPIGVGEHRHGRRLGANRIRGSVVRRSVGPPRGRDLRSACSPLRLALAMTWPFLRDIPVRQKSS